MIERLQPDAKLSPRAIRELAADADSVLGYCKTNLQPDTDGWYSAPETVEEIGPGRESVSRGMVREDPVWENIAVRYDTLDQQQISALDNEGMREDMLDEAYEALYDQRDKKFFTVNDMLFDVGSIDMALNMYPDEVQMIVRSSEIITIVSDAEDGPHMVREFVAERFFRLGDLEVGVGATDFSGEDENLYSHEDEMPDAELDEEPISPTEERTLEDSARDYSSATQDDVARIRELFAHLA